MRRGSRTPLHIVERIHALHDQGYSARQITEKLEQELEAPPKERTVRGIVQQYRPTDTSGPWSLADPDFAPEDARAVLPVLAELLRTSEWRVRTVTRAEARWIARIGRAATMPPLNALRYARLYMAREIAGKPTHDLDRRLAIGEWEGLGPAIEAHYGEQVKEDDDGQTA